MIARSINEVTFEDIKQLLANQVREGRTIDYKRDLPGDADSDKIRFLADISSFANTSGGDLVFGIDEAGGVPVTILGLGLEDPDQAAARLDSIIRNGLEPRLPSLSIKPVSTEVGRWVIVLRIGQSWAAPHRVSLKDHSKFYGRNSTGKYPLDVGELRIAFTLSEAIADRIRNFRSERILKVVGDETPVPVLNGAKAI